MKAKSLSIAALEKRAGLKVHAVRNILKGRVKKPRAELLVAIATALECSILDFIDFSSVGTALKKTYNVQSKKNIPLDHPDLMLSCTRILISLLAEKGLNPSLENYFNILKMYYSYSLTEEPKMPDIKFANWLLENEE